MGAQNRVSTHLSEKNTSVYEKNTVHPEKLLKKTHEINYQNPSFFFFFIGDYKKEQRIPFVCS